MTSHRFDDRNISWKPLGDLEHVHYWMLGIDEPNKIADTLFRFAADKQIVLHRHTSLIHTLVVQGEHRIYEPDGRLKQARPTGRYTISPASPEPHREGGGSGQDVIVLFSWRGSDGVLAELLDEARNVIGTLTFEGFKDLYREQQAGRAAVPA